MDAGRCLAAATAHIESLGRSYNAERMNGETAQFWWQETMSRWQKRIDNLLADLEQETPGAEDFRVNIDQKISEAEAAVSKPHDEEAFALAENPQQRRREFLEALRPALIARQGHDPSNIIWSEALLLLDNPQLRVLENGPNQK